MKRHLKSQCHLSPRMLAGMALFCLIFSAGPLAACAAGKFHKILFLGNSITLHRPKADIGWTGNWGMAASSREKDYAHLVAKALTPTPGAPPEIMVENIAKFERNYATYDIDTELKKFLDFGADLIIVAIGENVKTPVTAGEREKFQSCTTQLLRKLKGNGHPTLVVRSCFWPNPAKDQCLQRACREAGGIFVDIGALDKYKSNQARAERKIQHAGVAAHPGDKGMQAIAGAILSAIGGTQEAKPRMKLGAYYFAGWSGKSPYDDGAPEHAWAKGMPTHFTKKLATEFAGRTPVWGWREDSPEITARQIDLAADHGIAFFAYCWYFKDSEGLLNVEKIEQNPLHEPMKMFMAAKNNTRMEFCLLVDNTPNRAGIVGEAWKQASDYWIKNYFRHPRYLRMDGKPIIMFFVPQGVEKAGLDYLQEAARKAGFPGVLVAGCSGGKPEDGIALKAFYNVKPNGTWKGNSEEHTYQELVEANVRSWRGTAGQPIIPVVTQGWDRRPWEAKNGEGLGKGAPVSWYFTGGTPAAFESQIERMAQWMDAHPDQVTQDHLAMVYAWNEIGEGGWLVPCREDPDGAYLKAIRRVVLGR